MIVGVIIVAAGRGERLGGETPKQLLAVGGRTLLQRSVAALQATRDLASMVVVLPPDLAAEGASLIGGAAAGCRFVAGGARRQDSVARGFAALPAGIDVVLVHDAARPFVAPDLIERVSGAAASVGAAIPALQARDTVKRASADGGTVAETLPRETIWLAQTPQGFRREVLAAAIALGQSGVDATDEAMLAERAGFTVALVGGDERNMKITTPDDLAAARRMAAAAPRVGTGYDLHRLVVGRPMTLAGITLPFERGPAGHSDGDVVCHALADALFGAAGIGDIGQHFPDTDPAWKDAPGLDLLARAVAIVAAQGWRSSSADVTVILERPRLAPHVQMIRERIATVLGVDPSAVNVKGKTNEGVDAVGRGEAIAAHAVAVLVAGGAA
jgi:2-C-methyl-D-erythritol 4-phosphate cytidylyltransferase/2-C-methyl-D-erythritol 2,4-cyclodiphosphate synthase